MLYTIVKFSGSLLLQITSGLKGSRAFWLAKTRREAILFEGDPLAFTFQRQEREERNLKNSHKTKREMQQVGCNTASQAHNDECVMERACSLQHN